MLPSIFGESLLDDWFDFPSERDFFGSHNPVFGKHAKNLMRTDIRETDTSYELDVDLPGFKKEDIKAQVENGDVYKRQEHGVRIWRRFVTTQPCLEISLGRDYPRSSLTKDRRIPKRSICMDREKS